jgi:pimeloyl-ACP methyl ester carboxylesterase/protein-S-isoprenylcysteine O-methyltransferase Ste14
MLARALLAFLALPGVVAYFVPLLLARLVLRNKSFQFQWGLALVPLLLGTGVLLWCVREFFVRGKGTVAPWDPPRQLVASGPYRWSRNPIYIAVSLILIGWALGFGSLVLAAYAIVVMLAFHLRVVLHEEPWLARAHRTDWKAYRSTVPRWVFRSRKAVAIAWIILLAAIPVAGLGYEIAAEAATAELTPPGRLVDVGGRRIHLLCDGDGEPTVFFEASGWGTALSSERVRKRVAGVTRVCSYDRRGNGWSDPGSSVASAGDLARDLAVLQDRAAIPWPFVIVASSIGGLTAEMYARQFSERTAGLVLLDAATSLSLPLLESVSGRTSAVLCASSVLARFGVIRLVDPFQLAGDRDRRQTALMAYGPGPWGQLCAMARGLSETRDAFAAAPPFPRDVPLVVLSAATDDSLVPPVFRRFVDAGAMKAALEQQHKQFAGMSTRGTWETVPESTHLIAESQPDAVAKAILALLAERR